MAEKPPRGGVAEAEPVVRLHALPVPVGFAFEQRGVGYTGYWFGDAVESQLALDYAEGAVGRLVEDDVGEAGCWVIAAAAEIGEDGLEIGLHIWGVNAWHGCGDIGAR